MSATDDATLLSRYAKSQSDEAFRVLANRYASLVYSVCARELGNPELAEDATQAVFLILAKKASHLRVDRTLAGWLYATSRKISVALARKERRRMRNEAKLDRQESVDDSNTAMLRIVVWDALDRLRVRDRDAIILRYWQGLSLEEVGNVQGASEGATRMRIDRALERMRRSMSSVEAKTNIQDALLEITLPAPVSLIQTLDTFTPASVPLRIAIISKGAHSAMSTVLKFSLAACLATASVAGVFGLTRAGAHRSQPASNILKTTSASAPKLPPIGPLRSGTKCVLTPRYFVGQKLRYNVTLENLDEHPGMVKLSVSIKVTSIKDGKATMKMAINQLQQGGPVSNSGPEGQSITLPQEIHAPIKMGITGMPDLTIPDQAVDVGQKWPVGPSGSNAKSEGWITFQGLKEVKGKKLAQLGVSVKWPGDPGSGEGTVFLDSDNQIVSLDWAVNALPATLKTMGIEVQSPKNKLVRTVAHLQRL